MTKIKTKTFKNTLVGIEIPCTKTDINTGKVGTTIEDLIEDTGIKVNRYDGIDLIDYGVEVKSRCSYANTFITVATMHRDYIINTPYKDSIVFKKLQQVRIVDYDFDEIAKKAIITDDKVYDWSDAALQHFFEENYEKGRSALIKGRKPRRRWELKTGTKNSFIFKIYATDWEKMKARINCSLEFNNMFTKV